MERPFRLIDLPSIPLRMVFQKMEIPQLYFLSILRRQLIDVIASSTVQTIISLSISYSDFAIVLYKLDGSSLRWSFSSDCIHRPDPYLKDFVLHPRYDFLFGEKSRFVEHAKNIIANLKKIFHHPQLYLTLEMNFFSHFKAIFGENDFDRCSQLRLEGISCNTEQMDRLRRTLKRVDMAYSEVDMNADVESRKWLLNSKHLRIFNALYSNRGEWFTSEDLMASTCSTYQIQRHQLTEQDMNQFIRKWIDNQSPQLKLIVVYFDRDVRREEVMRGLDLQQYDPDRYPSHQTSEYYKRLSNLRDVYESNGRFVSFSFGYHILLKVWHEENH